MPAASVSRRWRKYDLLVGVHLRRLHRNRGVGARSRRLAVLMADEFHVEAKLKALRREIAKRRTVYPRLIEKGRMNPDFANREIRIMEAIAEDYEALAKKERLI